MLSFVLPMLATVEDRDFVTAIYGEFRTLMLATARRYVPDRGAAEDVVQDSLVKLIRHADLLQRMNRCTLASYIVSTVRNTAIDRLRGDAAERRYLLPLELEKLCLTPSPEESVEETAQKREDLERMRTVWPRLEEEQRLLLEGKYLLDQTDTELASRLGCKQDSVRMKLTRARRRVLELLREGGVPDE